MTRGPSPSHLAWSQARTLDNSLEALIHHCQGLQGQNVRKKVGHSNDAPSCCEGLMSLCMQKGPPLQLGAIHGKDLRRAKVIT